MRVGAGHAAVGQRAVRIGQREQRDIGAAQRQRRAVVVVGCVSVSKPSARNVSWKRSRPTSSSVRTAGTLSELASAVRTLTLPWKLAVVVLRHVHAARGGDRERAVVDQRGRRQQSASNASAYRNGLSVEPACRGATTPSTSAARRQLAAAADVGEHVAGRVVEHDERAVLDAARGELGQMIAQRVDRVALQRASSVVVSCSPGALSSFAARCGASSIAAAGDSRPPATREASARIGSHGDVRRRRRRDGARALRDERRLARRARASSATRIAASRASTPAGALPNKPCVAARSPLSSPRNDDRLRYASRICALVHVRSSARAAAAWSHFCASVRGSPPSGRSAGSSRPGELHRQRRSAARPPAVELRHTLSHAATARPGQSTPSCS